ncbi:sal-like protein 1 isoform X3 [Ruditapes philippinarum]|uniref:sal-like protein 1 isoform X3 n=1 Tax=Ruditapes philippinarum TaxID=129788 RepID=UPI00295A8206|nr:sal-like protein 1 isoform X3 [Ruditapes philippinarum]
MATPDMEVIKDIPGYKVILKAIIKSQIQQLVEQLASTTEEESVILTASVADGTLCHLGSDSGKVFLEDHEDIKSQFLGFCLKRHHKKKQEQERKEAQEKEEALARNMQAVTPPRYDGMGNRMGFMSQRSPRFQSPRQQGPHPVSMSRVASRGRVVISGNRHQPYSMARPARPTLSFDQQVRSPAQGPGPMVTPVRNTKLDGQVIKIEPEDEDEKSNQSANENTNVQSDVKTNISESSQPSSPSIKPSTPSQTQGPSASDNEDARSESSSSTIPNEASDLKFSDTNPAAGLSLDSDLSNILPTDSSVNEPSTSQGNEQGTMEGLDPNISVKLEAFGDSEMDLEITGVELGQNTLTQEQMSSQEWMANVQNVMQGASGSSADMAGQQGYTGQSEIETDVHCKTRSSSETLDLEQSEVSMVTPLVETPDVGMVTPPVGRSDVAIVMPPVARPDVGMVTPLVTSHQLCIYCNRLMQSECALKVHMRIHTGEKPFKCHLCNRAWAQKNNLTRHMRKVHNNDIT